MSQDLLCLYQQIRETPALTVDFPEESGKGRITRLDTNSFSISSWDMEFNRDTLVEGNVANDMRILFCSGEGVEWTTGNGPMRLDHNDPIGYAKLVWEECPEEYLKTATDYTKLSDLR